MSSILTNASALSALQSLTQTQAALKTTENQVSTGLAVSSAADNASYWSIATQLSADSGVVTAANSALSQSQAVLSTASSAINSVITTINSIETALTQAANPGREHHRHRHDARLARQPADRRGQRRLVQRPQRSRRHQTDARSTSSPASTPPRPAARSTRSASPPGADRRQPAHDDDGCSRASPTRRRSTQIITLIVEQRDARYGTDVVTATAGTAPTTTYTAGRRRHHDHHRHRRHRRRHHAGIAGARGDRVAGARRSITTTTTRRSTANGNASARSSDGRVACNVSLDHASRRGLHDPARHRH